MNWNKPIKAEDSIEELVKELAKLEDEGNDLAVLISKVTKKVLNHDKKIANELTKVVSKIYDCTDELQDAQKSLSMKKE